MSMTAVPISMRLVLAPIAARSGNGEASCLAKWWTLKYAPSAPSSSAATARSMDCRSASDAVRVCEWGDGVQWPNDRNPIFYVIYGECGMRQEPGARRGNALLGASLTSAGWLHPPCRGWGYEDVRAAPVWMT